jgi:hypothetical protein
MYDETRVEQGLQDQDPNLLQRYIICVDFSGAHCSRKSHHKSIVF